MADRIVVMHEGRIQQVADPLDDLDPAGERRGRRPFMGDNNIFGGTVAARDGDRARRRERRGGDAQRSAPGVDADGRAVGRGLRSRRRRAGRRRARAADGPNEHPGRDRLRRVPRRPGQAPPLGRGRAAAREGRRRPLSRVPGHGRKQRPALLEGGGCPAPRGLTASRAGLHVDEIVQAEQVVGEEARARGEGGARRARSRPRRGLTTAAWVTPGALWLLFFVVAPVVMIILVSFWTRTVSGFETIWTLDNYDVPLRLERLLGSALEQLLALARDRRALRSCSAFRSRTSSRSASRACATRSRSSSSRSPRSGRATSSARSPGSR